MSDIITELQDTVELMMSPDHRDRFEAELLQVKIRRTNLSNMLVNWRHLDFVPKCPYEILVTQLKIMDSYIEILETRRSLYEKE